MVVRSTSSSRVRQVSLSRQSFNVVRPAVVDDPDRITLLKCDSNTSLCSLFAMTWFKNFTKLVVLDVIQPTTYVRININKKNQLVKVKHC